jgi:serine carboxypeptidase-like clade 2
MYSGPEPYACKKMFAALGSLCSGDQDSVIPLTGSRTLVHGLAKRLRLKATVPYRVWFEGKQVCELRSIRWSSSSSAPLLAMVVRLKRFSPGMCR